MTLQIGRTLAFLAVLFLCPAHAHAGWDWLYPQPQGNHLHDIEFLTETTAIAVGDAGTIMITHDTGLTWSFVNQVNGIEGALHRIRRINNSTALVVGDDGVILKTTNAGATWTAKTSGTTDNLIDLAVVPAYAMAIGSARVVQSTNAGDTWTVLPWSDEVAQYGSFGGVSVVAPAVASACGSRTASGTGPPPESPRRPGWRLAPSRAGPSPRSSARSGLDGERTASRPAPLRADESVG
jgi:photosystem II stability/assembly factor-like uncharacterized protein